MTKKFLKFIYQQWEWVDRTHLGDKLYLNHQDTGLLRNCILPLYALGLIQLNNNNQVKWNGGKTISFDHELSKKSSEHSDSDDQKEEVSLKKFSDE